MKKPKFGDIVRLDDRKTVYMGSGWVVVPESTVLLMITHRSSSGACMVLLPDGRVCNSFFFSDGFFGGYSGTIL